MYKINIEKIRDKNHLDITQSELAKALGVTRDVVAKWERNPENLRIDTLLKIADFAGMELSELLEYSSYENNSIHIDNHRKSLDSLKQNIMDFLNRYNNLSYSFLEEDIDKIKNTVSKITDKPIIAFLGLMNSGKTTMINSLLGTNIFPTGWKTNTSTLVKIKHIMDKPIEMGKFNVKLVYRNVLKKEDKCISYDLLNYYATQQNEDIDLIDEIVVYVDNDILCNCDFYDFPGFTNNDSYMVNKYSDINVGAIVYLSQANKFMNGDDITNLLDWLKRLSIVEHIDNDGLFGKFLPNLFIIASKAKTINYKSENDLKDIIKNACEKMFENSLTDNFFDNRAAISQLNYNKEQIEERFFYYAFEDEELRKNFELNFNEFLSLLPSILLENIHLELIQQCKDKLNFHQEQISELKAFYDKKNELLPCIDGEINRLPFIHKQIVEKKEILKESIETHKVYSKYKFFEYYDSVINAEAVEAMITDEYSNNDTDTKSFMNMLSNKLNNEMVKICSSRFDKVNVETRQVVQKLNLDLTLELKKYGISIKNVDTLSFHKNVFGDNLLSFLTTTGGFFAGYYLGKQLKNKECLELANKTLLSSVALAASNPLTFGITLSVISTVTFLTLRNTGWKKTLAKRIVASYKKNDIRSQYNEVIDKCWESFGELINQDLDKVYSIYKDYLYDIKSSLETDLHDKVRDFEIFKSFYEELEQIVSFEIKECNRKTEDL